MKWFKRCSWLAAWSVWLWLGFGLYRELPRDLGRPVCKLAFEEDDEPLGFLDEGDVVVSRLQKNRVDESKLTLWNARTGAKIAVRRGPSFENNSRKRTCVSMRHGVVVGVHPADSSEALQILDLRTGDWRPVPDRLWQVLDVHPTKPWAVGVRQGDEDAPELTVFDLQTGARVARRRWETPPFGIRDFAEACRFRDDGIDEMLVLIERLDAGRESTRRFEFWNFGGGPSASPVKLKEGDVELSSRWCQDGNVLLTRYYTTQDREPYLAVVHARTGETVFSSESVPELFRSNRYLTDSQLSASGRSFLSIEQDLWNVAERSRIWSAHDQFEYVFRVETSNESFLVFENWTQLLGTTRLPFEGHTWAVRDFGTGAVRYRAARQHPFLNRFSSDGRLGVMSRGEVYAFPLPVNWPLLALSQTLLASPLVLLWWVLQVRRKRAARRQPAVALDSAVSP